MPLDSWQTEIYCIVASTALLWFDWALMFPGEVRRIWKRRFTGATMVYLFNRYTALFEGILLIAEVLAWDIGDQSCGMLTRADDTLTALNYFAFAAFTIIRVYAVWGRDWKPLLVVIPLSLARPFLFVAGSVFHVPVQGGPLYGCMRVYTLPDEMMSKFETISIATTVASEGIFLALTWIRTYGIKKDWSRLGVHAPLTTLLLRDGTAYFVTLFPSKILAIISDLSASPTLFLRIWPYFDETLTVCFLCRFMLDLRGVYFSDDLENELDRTMYLSNLRFGSSVIGNLGANLKGHVGHDYAYGHAARDLDSYASTADYDEDEDLSEFIDNPFPEGIQPPLEACHRSSC